MTFEPKYCSHCRVTLVPRQIENRVRECCPSCGKIFYRNPLPVASSLVLNDQRQVLLVKRARDPQQGLWCLPIGFAELNETIEEAALRELKEEAGVTGKIKHLLDVHSHISDFYGDLLIVTFEIGEIEGEIQAGDDASDAAWYKLTELPPLAFPANDEAIAKCVAYHQPEWNQAQSFAHLDDRADESLLSYRLVAVVEQHAEEIVTRWHDHLQHNPATPSYRRLDTTNLRHHATDALQHLGRWLSGDVSHAEVGAFFETVGGEHGASGVAPHELLIALTFMRQTIWEFCRKLIDTTDSVSTYAALELNQRIIHFFDHAAFESNKGLIREAID